MWLGEEGDRLLCACVSRTPFTKWLSVATQVYIDGPSRHATYRRVALPRILLQWEWQLLLIGQTLSSGRGPAPFTKSLTGAPVKASSQLLVRSVRYTHMYFGYR
ncbi:hypothetical protein J6590_062078 [Homalodisca vitripennis]|nr:hypothetical protein J6590_062078 [Homalodisca vitripennis]